MTDVRTQRGLAAAWLVVVVCVASLTWIVVDAVGRDVDAVNAGAILAGRAESTRRPPASSPSAAASSLPAPSATPTEADHGATEGEAEESEATGSTPRTPATIAPGAGTHGAVLPPAPDSGGSSTAPPAPPAPVGPTAVVRTFGTTGGTVVVSCTGPVLTVRGVTPKDGFTAEEDAEDNRLQVTFKSRRDDEVKLVVRCVDGVPTSRTDS